MHTSLKSPINFSLKAALCGFLFISACTSTRQQAQSMYLKSDLEVFEFSKINPKNRIQGAAYVDSVQFANKHHTNGLNIFGNTPDGCSKIDIKSSFQNDSLIVTIISTKERDQMCTMALTPFRYFVPFETLGVRTENQPSLKYIQVNQINVKPNL